LILATDSRLSPSNGIPNEHGPLHVCNKLQLCFILSVHAFGAQETADIIFSGRGKAGCLRRVCSPCGFSEKRQHTSIPRGPGFLPGPFSPFFAPPNGATNGYDKGESCRRTVQLSNAVRH
jgi:hypothetical protein